MAKKSVTKSKPATKQLLKKYQFAGANSSTYQQVANPYYVSGDFSEESKKEADRAYRQAIYLGDFATAEQIKVDAETKEREAQEKQAREEMLDQAKALKEQEVAGYGQQVANVAGDQGLAFAKEKLGERAARKAAEKTATDALANAGSTAANVASTGANTVAQSVVPTLSIQAARGSGMEAARAATSLIDDTGAVVLPQAANTGANVGAGVGSAAATGASTAANTGLMAANMSGLASAGIGLGLTGAGMLVQRKMDTDPTKYSKQEGKQNAIGDALKGAGTGFGLGATAGTIVPGVGNVVGGIVGGLAGFGIGLAKGIRENRKMQGEAGEFAAEEARIAAERAEAERKRKAELTQQKDLLAQRYNQAFTSSRLMGSQTGFGYNTSTNMNMQPTSSFYGKTGGAKVPGGQIVPIEGTDAVKFVGRKHSEGGIKIDPQTEVEGGETMDQVMMNGGKPNDYFFSSYLKLGGKSFAKRHQEILKSGGSQKQIQDLAKMQESIANKKGEKDRGPEQIAAYGGIHRYDVGGPVKPTRNLPEGYEWKQVAIDGNMEWSAEPIQPASLGAKVDRDAPEGTEWREGKMPDGSAVLVNTPTNKFKLNGDVKGKVTIKNNQGQQVPVPRAGRPAYGSYPDTPQKSANAQSNSNAKNVTVRDQNQANAKAPKAQTSVAPGGTTNNAGQSSANAAKKGKAAASKTSEPYSARAPLGSRAVEGEEQGVSISMKGVPTGQGKGNKFYGNVTDQQYADMVKANPWYDFSNFDPANEDQVLNFQKEYNKRVKEGEKLKEDGKFGEQTATSRLYVVGEKMAGKDATLTPEGKPELKKSNADLSKGEFIPEEEKQIARMKRGVNGSLLAGLGQLIPVGYALARPYKAEGALPRMEGGGNVGAGSVRGAILPRVNMNAERAAAERNTVAVKNAIQNTNAGPGGIAAMMAANASQNNQNLTIANQEQEANKQLAAEEARLGMQASMSNAEMAQRANMANVQNRLAVNQANLDAGIQEARMKIDEKRYKREEILGALDTAASRIAGIVKDEKSYKAQERLAKAIDNTGSYDRFTIFEQLQKESKNKNSPYYGKTDIELKKIASDTYNEVAGKMGLEGVETERTGGSRKYTSRLGQLSRGRKTFNI